MNTFITALKGEYIKKRGTGLYWLAFAMGAFMPLLYAVVTIVKFKMGTQNADRIPYNYFTEYIGEMLGGYSQFFFPLFIIIAVSRLTQTDHKNGGWQLMETMPIKRWDIYSAKLSMVLTANLISILSLIIISFAAGSFALLFIETPKVASFSFEFVPILEIVLRLFVASLFFTCLQYMISVLITSFVWSILIGFFMLLGYLFLNVFKVIPGWYPLEILGHVGTYVKGSELGYPITVTETASLVLAVLAMYIGFTWYRYKGFKSAFITSGKRMAYTAGVLAVTVALTYFMFSPKQSERYHKTILAGKIESKQQFTTIIVTDPFVNDTVAVIPVKNNTFHHEIKQNIALGVYNFSMNGLGWTEFMGPKDSIYTDVKQSGKVIEAKVTGTRLAENSFNEQNTPEFRMSSIYIENSEVEDTEVFANQLYDDWKDAMAETTKFRTADNYVPGDDFVKQQKQLQTLEFLNDWQKFVSMRKVAYPGKPTPENAGIKEIKNMVPLNDVGLLSFENYFTYVRSLMVLKDRTETDDNTKALTAIAQLKPGEFKDKMLLWQLRNSLREASNTQERVALEQSYGTRFANPRFTQNIMELSAKLNNIEKGKPAPEIALTNLQGKPATLAQLRGKYVAIDVWATWCGPCRQESPYFEKLAIKYKGENIQFVGISTDHQIDKWYFEAKLKSSSVLQLHAADDKTFSNDYDIQGIPRFILIDKEGKIVNADMPRPSDKTFEQVIRRELGLKEL
ncbi:redoxin family protein [Flavobacterium sp. RNTU_13]|uniref:redoxin family protein n=1 Tax=Flavobacterium sp. RNTU_13 TaxID=3375145 RepID=UPI0039884615